MAIITKKILDLVVGNIDEKKNYHQFMKRVNALPNEYRFAFKKIQQYLYTLGSEDYNMIIFMDLLELFESSVYEHKSVLEVVGSDVASFCDELIYASSTNTENLSKQLNQEILNYFDTENSTCHKQATLSRKEQK